MDGFGLDPEDVAAPGAVLADAAGQAHQGERAVLSVAADGAGVDREECGGGGESEKRHN